MKKRLGFALIVICVMTFYMSMMVCAKEVELKQYDVDYNLELDAQYSGVSKKSSKAEESSYKNLIADNLQQVRSLKSAFLNRKTTISLNINATRAGSDDWPGILNALYKEACAESTKENEGDYLFYSIRRCQAKVSYTEISDVSISITATYFTTAAQEETVNTSIGTVINSLGLTTSTPTYEKIQKVHDYIAQKVSYDYAHLDDSSYMLKYSAYAALIKKQAVSQGYALLFYRFMKRLGVPVRCIPGKANDYRHMWNIVELQGEFYEIDPTWDSTPYTRRWYLMSNKTFLEDHQREEEYGPGTRFWLTYPAATEDFEWALYEPVKTISIDAKNFPDANFRKYIADYLDTNNDEELSVEEQTAVEGLDLNNKGISSLTGIGYFENLTTLNISENKFVVLNLSDCRKLRKLYAESMSTLETVILPSVASSVEALSLKKCPKLRRVVFAGNASTYLASSSTVVFSNTANIIAYYPTQNNTWTNVIKNKLGAKKVEWNPYVENVKCSKRGGKSHILKVGAVVEPTCTKVGSAGAITCTSCEAVIIAKTKVALADHTPGAAATHITPQKCTVCGTVLKPAMGHTYSTKWKFNSEKHWKECSCGAKKDIKAHENKNTVTSATLTENGKIVKACTICGRVVGSSIVYRPKSIKLSKKTFEYDGQVKNPTVTVKDINGNVISNDYYTVTKSAGRKKVGSYKYTITFKGKYSGSKSLEFVIKPKKVTLQKLTAKSKGFKVSWKAVSEQVSGYEIRYSRNSTMSNSKKTTVIGWSNKMKLINGLTKKKRYYVQIRSYKKAGGKKYYSKWSNKMSVVTKK